MREAPAGQGFRPSRLRVEHLDTALGLTEPRPRLSWRPPAGSRRQVAYQLRVGPWDSGRLESADHLLVPYGGPPLASRDRIDWTVKVWTAERESEWADVERFEIGLLDPGDWEARWIQPPGTTADVHLPDGRRVEQGPGEANYECPL